MTTITLPRAVVEQTLNALDAFSWEQVDAARIALRAALAQQAQQAEPVEPVATVAENATTQQRVVETPPSDYRRGYWDGFNIGKREGRIEAEDALAQQAEPVEPVWIQPNHLQKARVAPFLCRVEPTQRFPDFIALYTAPPQRKPLSNEELDRLWREPMSADWEHREFARAVERAHGIKE
jgi:hypothetical protein